MQDAPRPQRPAASNRGEWIALVTLFIAASALFARFSILKHLRLESTGYDLGIFDQALWHLSRFETPESTIRRVPTIFADHFHPLIALFAPLYWFGDGLKNLLVAQALVVCSSAFPVFLFCRPRLGARASLAVVFGLLFFWGIVRGLAYDFHEVALTTPLAAWLLLAFDRAHSGEGKWWPVGLLALAVLLTKEDQGFLIAAFGAIALLRREWKIGAPLALVGAAWPFFVMKVLHPLFSPSAYSFWVYGHIAPSMDGVILYALRSPIAFAKLLVSPAAKRILLVRLLLPFGLFALVSPYALLLLPNLLLRLLSGTPQHALETNHYTLPIAPLLAMAVADGLGRLLARFPALSRRELAYGAAMLLVGWTGLETRRYGLLESFKPSWSALVDERAPMRTALQAIPKEATVAATSSLVPHLSQRAELYQMFWSVDVPPVDYVAVRDGDYYADDAEVWVALRGDYDRIAASDGVRVYRRRSGADPAYARLKARSFDDFQKYVEIALRGEIPHTPLTPRLKDPGSSAEPLVSER